MRPFMSAALRRQTQALSAGRGCRKKRV